MRARIKKDDIVIATTGKERFAKKTGKEPKLAEGVGVVPGGVIRIMELQEQGYSYIRP